MDNTPACSQLVEPWLQVLGSEGSRVVVAVPPGGSHDAVERARSAVHAAPGSLVRCWFAPADSPGGKLLCADFVAGQRVLAGARYVDAASGASTTLLPIEELAEHTAPQLMVGPRTAVLDGAAQPWSLEAALGGQVQRGLGGVLHQQMHGSGIFGCWELPSQQLVQLPAATGVEWLGSRGEPVEPLRRGSRAAAAGQAAVVRFGGSIEACYVLVHPEGTMHRRAFWVRAQDGYSRAGVPPHLLFRPTRHYSTASLGSVDGLIVLDRSGDRMPGKAAAQAVAGLFGDARAPLMLSSRWLQQQLRIICVSSQPSLLHSFVCRSWGWQLGVLCLAGPGAGELAAA